MFAQIINTLSDLLYTYILIILLLATGIYFTFRTKFVQFRMLREAIRVVMEPKDDENGLSSFQALMVSTASRVGTGNIAGISTAICLGGPGAVFWMWITALLGSASAFIESTLAQIYKRRAEDGSCYGGPAYYIQAVLKRRWIGVLFAVFLILTYMVGFNLVASFNIVDTFRAYSFFDESTTPLIIGGILAVIFCICICGGSKQISKITGFLVPLMGIFYLALALFVVVTHFELIPKMFADIFTNAFDFQAIFGGFTGSCIMQGIKRGLFSNEAGSGSAPCAAAAAESDHPAKVGLMQALGVFIDTIIICSCTAMIMLLAPAEVVDGLTGMDLLQAAMAYHLGEFGVVFIAAILWLFSFSTFIGILFYARSNVAYLFGDNWLSQTAYKILALIMLFAGGLATYTFVWDLGDVGVGLMTVFNIAILFPLSGQAMKSLKDYEQNHRLRR